MEYNKKEFIQNYVTHNTQPWISPGKKIKRSPIEVAEATWDRLTEAGYGDDTETSTVSISYTVIPFYSNVEDIPDNLITCYDKVTHGYVHRAIGEFLLEPKVLDNADSTVTLTNTLQFGDVKVSGTKEELRAKVGKRHLSVASTTKPVDIKDIAEEDACPNICNGCGIMFSATGKAKGSSGLWRAICSICNSGPTWCNAPRDWEMFSWRRDMDNWTDAQIQQHQDWIVANNKDNTI